MSLKQTLKENFVLIVGLTLPALLMIGFMLSTLLPNMATPPKHDLVFAMTDYSGSGKAWPFYINLYVKDGTLYANYQPTQNNYMNTAWKKLYLFDAETQKVQELPLDMPPEPTEDMKKQQFVVEATKDMKLDTHLTAPDGYEFIQGGYSRSGLVNELFIGGGRNNGIRIRKGASSIKLPPSDGRGYYYYGADFLGWVVSP